MDLESLSRMTRDELIEQARRIGVGRAEHMTRAELRDEIVRRTEDDAQRRRAARGWFGVARDLIAGVVEAGLHLPDAARMIRGEVVLDPRYQPPVATVTLAEIYATQGHLSRALRMLDEVLAKEPDHEVAHALRAKLATRASSEEQPDARGADGGEREPDAQIAARQEQAVRRQPSESEAESSAPAAAAVEDPTVLAPSEAEPPVEGATSGQSAVEAAGAGPVESTEKAPPASDEAPRQAPSAAAHVAGPPAIVEDALYLARKGDTVELYWELTPHTERRLRERLPGATAVIRVVSFTPVRMRAERLQRDVAIQANLGVMEVECATESAVRAALGWRSEQGFRPVAVATHVAPSQEAPVYVPYATRPAADPAARVRALEQLGIA